MNLLLALLFLASTTWTETWSNGTTNWVDGAGQPFTCSTAGNVLHATRGCDQQAFSIYRWDQTQPVSVSGTVRGQPVGTTPYFCGLALIEAADHNIYGQPAVGRDTQPIWPQDGQPHIVFFNDEYPNPAERIQYFRKAAVNDWEAFTVTWTPSNTTGSGVWSATINGKATQSFKDYQVTSPLTVDLQGAPLLDDGSECQFGPVTVQGVLSP